MIQCCIGNYNLLITNVLLRIVLRFMDSVSLISLVLGNTPQSCVAPHKVFHPR